MKQLIIPSIFMLASFMSSGGRAQTPTNTYNNYNATTDQFNVIPSMYDAQFSQMTRGTGVTAQTGIDGQKSSGFTAVTLNDAVANGQFVTFTASAGFSSSGINVSNIILRLRKDINGPQYAALQYRIGNSGSFQNFSTGGSNTTINFEPSTGAAGTEYTFVVPAYTKVFPGQTITFRLVAWGAPGAGSELEILNGSTLNVYVGVPLPVTLTSFDGKADNSFNQLTWKTASEQNIAYYEVEKSFTGSGFEPVSTIPATNFGTGYDYEYNDAITITGNIYYRLKMVDKDGAFQYSRIVKLTSTASGDFSLSGNFISRNIVVVSNTANKETINYFVYDLSGRLVKHTSSATLSNTSSIDVSDLLPAMYILNVQSAGYKGTFKFVKQ